MQHFSQIMSIKTYCINFYGIELWSKYRKTTLLRITASYVKCIKMFFNPQMPKVKIHLRTPKGGWVPPPWIFAFPSEFFENISHGYVFGVKESNGDNEKILSSLHDLENQGQTPFCMTFLISRYKHDTKLILVSILTFFEVEDIKYVGKNHVTLTVDLGTQGHTHCMTFLISGCIQATDLILVSILTFARSRISENPK